MSGIEQTESDLQEKKISQINPISFVDYVRDATREESLIGLQYVVELKMLESDKSIIKCNLCNVQGLVSSMKAHLIGIHHIKHYMEKHYTSVLQSLKRSSTQKVQFTKLLKDYAREIERAEGTQSVKIEFVSEADMKKGQETWMGEKEERFELHADRKKFQVLDKRQMALNYSEKFKIESREEATIVLNLTQQLSDQLEQYFLKYKGLEFLDSPTPDSIPIKSIPPQTNFPPIHENLHPKSDANQGSKNEMQWQTEEQSSSVRTPISVRSFDQLPLEDTKMVKRKHEVSENAFQQHDVLPESSSASEFQSRKKKPHKEHDHLPTTHSYFPYMNVMGSPQHSSAEVSSSHSSSNVSTYTHISIPKEKSCVPKTFGEERHMVKDIPQNSISKNSLNDNISKIETVQEIKSLNSTDTTDTSEVGAAKNSALPEPEPSSTSSCSYEPSYERPSSSHAQGKTSKALSPDILKLLKGKDANTVTNILRTISPFYPALQEVNLEILAQVLVNTGALD